MSSPFLDTNVLLYLLSGDAVKADRAESLLMAGGVVSVQVLNEAIAVCQHKLKLSWDEIDLLRQSIQAYCSVQALTPEIQQEAVAIAKRYQFSIYDANILATALLSGCDRVYSEDMQSGFQLETLTIVNPFRLS
ncbi:PIN domain-containing protein [Synechococcus elongatus]|uniref:PIN domain-containing protein n=1 Tax=Synechococcus elongatus PCC 11802 TaxID=2283154 RepID=A0AAT9JTH9_SYNEL|nr:PIN domain-containing protein [Synechococcus elongatus]QFZ92459.1 PIN domain-containing protein [Synechococcus elongatus PCC 11802]